MEKNTKDVYARVTDQIVKAIEEGAPAFEMPWHFNGTACGEPKNVVSKRPYRGVNVLSLFGAARANKYDSGFWATYNQWHSLGAQVRKGEKATLVVLWKVAGGRDKQRKEDSPEQKEPEKQSLVIAAFSVFNLAQVDGYKVPDVPLLSESKRIERCEQFFSALGAEIKSEGDRAFYDAGNDRIVLPPYRLFRSPLSYYATMAHEVTHWSGAKCRLDRDLTGRFRTDSYAMEELVAELGAAFLCSRLEIASDPRHDHAGYIQDWLRVLKRDKKAIFTAATKAQQAADWLFEKAGQPAASMAA